MELPDQPHRRPYDNDEEYYSHQDKKTQKMEKPTKPFRGRREHIRNTQEFTRFFRDKSARILDAGSRDGSALAVMKDEGFTNTIGIDVSTDWFDLAAKWGVNIEFGDFNKLQFSDGEFDGVFCYYALEHSPHPEKALAEFTRILKPGGLIYLMIHLNYKSKFHRYDFNEARFREMMDALPFEELKYKHVPNPTHGDRARIIFIGKKK